MNKIALQQDAYRPLVHRISRHAVHGGVSLPGGSPCWGGLLAEGSALPGQGVSQHALRQISPCEQNHRRLWKYNLAPTSLRAVMIDIDFIYSTMFPGEKIGPENDDNAQMRAEERIKIPHSVIVSEEVGLRVLYALHLGEISSGIHKANSTFMEETVKFLKAT